MAEWLKLFLTTEEQRCCTAEEIGRSIKVDTKKVVVATTLPHSNNNLSRLSAIVKIDSGSSGLRWSSA